MRVKITETYDLSTEIGKMGIIGIHTPPTSKIKTVWGTALKSHQYFRLARCDVTLACASILPADPLQIGTEAGAIAPQDMFNPILYTAVSNEGFDRIINRLYSGTAVDLNTGAVNKEAFGDTSDHAFDTYYSLLSQGRFKKALPQAGLKMKGLRPIVFPMLSTYGNAETSSSSGATQGNVGIADMNKFFQVPSKEGAPVSGSWNHILRGRPLRMPAIPTMAVYQASTTSTSGTVYDASYPKTMVGAIIMPPGALHQLFFRMRVTWYIDFFGLRNDLQTASLTDQYNAGQEFYYTDFSFDSKTTVKTNSVDGTGIEATEIMTST